MAKWDHDDLMSKHDTMIKRYYDNWSLDSMPPTKPKPRKINPIPALDEPTTDGVPDDDELAEMLDSRMRWGTKDHSFNDVLVRRTGEIANVILVTEKEVMVIKDELNLFPSDALVTQLRLLGA